MKIKVIETMTEIEATAQEINASQTIGSRFASLLANALTPYRAYDEDEDEDEEGDENCGADNREATP